MITEHKDLELVQVDTDKTASEFVFYDHEAGDVKALKLYKQLYNEKIKKYIDSEEQEEKYFERLQEHFDCSDEDQLQKLIGQTFTIYEHNGFFYIWQPNVYSKFSVEDVGMIDTAEITDVKVGATRIEVIFEYEEEEYVSRFNFGRYIEHLNQTFPDARKKMRAYQRFLEKFDTPVNDAEHLIGKRVYFEVKENNFQEGSTYIEIKSLVKSKKKGRK